MAWLTPSSTANSGTVTITVPDEFIEAVLGAIAPMTQPESWEQYGTLTPNECAQVMTRALYEVQITKT